MTHSAASVSTSDSIATDGDTNAARGEGTSVRAQRLLARIDTLPASSWHARVRLLMGAATFFDAFDALAVASVLPVLIPLWHLSPTQIGLLIASGYIGQGLGALFFGRLAERVGRMPAAIASIVMFSTMSVICALSWNYIAFMVIRFIQGFGLGGEVPVAATYISEVSRAHSRGRYFMIYEAVFNLGIVISSLTGALVIPSLGWQVFMAAGALPAILILPMRMKVPESPRWLVASGQLARAEQVMQQIEREVYVMQRPPLAASEKALDADVASRAQPSSRNTGLFHGGYLKRTLSTWALWFCVFLVGYGTMTWMPSVILTIFHLSLKTSLWIGVGMNTLSLVATLVCAMFVDRIGRRRWLVGALTVSALAMLVLWQTASSQTNLWLLGAAAALSVAATASCGVVLYLYTPEIYSNTNRAKGVSTASVWGRIASIVGPFLIGTVLENHGIRGVYAIFSFVALIAACVALLFAVETSGRSLEEISS